VGPVIVNQRLETICFWPTALWSHWENGRNERPPNEHFIDDRQINGNWRVGNLSLCASLFRRCDPLAHNQSCCIFPLLTFKRALLAHRAASSESLRRVEYVMSVSNEGKFIFLRRSKWLRQWIIVDFIPSRFLYRTSKQKDIPSSYFFIASRICYRFTQFVRNLLGKLTKSRDGKQDGPKTASRKYFYMQA